MENLKKELSTIPDDIFELVNNTKPEGKENLQTEESKIYPMDKVIAEKKDLEDRYGMFELRKNLIPFYWYTEQIKGDNKGKTSRVEVGDRVEYINIENSFDKDGNFIGSIFGYIVEIDNQHVNISIGTGKLPFKFLMAEKSKFMGFEKSKKENKFFKLFNKNILTISSFLIILALIGIILTR